MGMFKRRWSGGRSAPKAPDPDPFHFTIRDEQVINGFSILLVHYPGCTTFDGFKLMLMKGKWDSSELMLDPHFLPDSMVLARFEPTPAGHALAVLCASNLRLADSPIATPTLHTLPGIHT